MTLFVISAYLFACSSHQTDEQTTGDLTEVAEVKDTTAITVDEETKFKFDFALKNIPSPVVMMNEVSKWGVPYNNEFFNDNKKFSEYTSEFSKSVNLGIYNMDLCYAMVSDKGADVLKYMKTVLILSDGIGLKGAVDQMVGKRAEKNMGNKDSLLTILHDIFVRSDSYLRTNDRVYTATCVFVGSWIESFYLIGKISDMSGNIEVKNKSYNHLWEQRQHLGNLIAVIEEYKEKPEAVELAKQFKMIHAELNAVSDSKNMTEKNFKSISEKIFNLRNKFTNP